MATKKKNIRFCYTFGILYLYKGLLPQRCCSAEEEQVVKDHRVHLEEDDESKVVGGSVFACWRQLPSWSQKEDSRGLS